MSRSWVMADNIRITEVTCLTGVMEKESDLAVGTIHGSMEKVIVWRLVPRFDVLGIESMDLYRGSRGGYGWSTRNDWRGLKTVADADLAIDKEAEEELEFMERVVTERSKG